MPISSIINALRHILEGRYPKNNSLILASTTCSHILVWEGTEMWYFLFVFLIKYFIVLSVVGRQSLFVNMYRSLGHIGHQ